MTTEHLGVLGAVTLALLVGVQIGRSQVAWTTRRRMRRQQHRALRAECDAARLLEALDYRVLQEQATTTYCIEVDGEPVPVEVRADYLVTREGCTYVAEVKSGEQAPSIQHANTRRQLLEYALAYAVDGTLLVDMEASAVHAVTFPEGSQALVTPEQPAEVVTDPWWLRGAAWALAGATLFHYAAEYLKR